MVWIALIVVVFIFFANMPEWLAFIASLFLFFAVLGSTRRKSSKGPEQQTTEPKAKLAPAYQKLVGLAVLRQALYERHESGDLDDARYQAMLAGMQKLERETLTYIWLPHEVKQNQLIWAWRALAKEIDEPEEMPSWLSPAEPETELG
ncbi:MAG: hypothetical protein AAF512_15625 [Pseudomonadota bacterium]